MSIKYTNKFNLDKPIYDWLTNDEYDHESDTISATTLLKSPRQVALQERHTDKIELDISDLVASRFGTAIHGSFAKALACKDVENNINYFKDEFDSFPKEIKEKIVEEYHKENMDE